MADLQQMSRILYHHDWVNIEDWACNVAQLADLTDEEIGQLQSPCGVDGPNRGSRHWSLLARSWAGGALLVRTRQRFATFCGGLRFRARRAY